MLQILKSDPALMAFLVAYGLVVGGGLLCAILTRDRGPNDLRIAPAPDTRRWGYRSSDAPSGRSNQPQREALRKVYQICCADYAAMLARAHKSIRLK